MSWTPDGESGGAGAGLAVPSHTQLCIADEATFWPWNNWPDLANWPRKEKTLVVVPVAGMADHGLDLPLDAEETVLLSVLKLASEGRPADLPLLVVPPLRYVLGPLPDCAFAIDPDEACTFLEEIVGSVGYAGFTRVVFFNASPWNEELTKAVGRDLRIHHRLQMFSVNLSALGLDFHPVRGGDRSAVRQAMAALTGAGSPEGTAQLQKSAAHLLSLLAEMRDRPALANGGEIPRQEWP